MWKNLKIVAKETSHYPPKKISMENTTDQDQQKKAENIRKKWTLATINKLHFSSNKTSYIINF